MSFKVKISDNTAPGSADAILSLPGFRWLGLLTMLALCGLAALFYQERACFVDFAYQSFGMIQKAGFNIQVNRFGVILVQILPLLAMKAGASLLVILVLYSVAIPLLFTACYALCVWYFKKDFLAWTILFLFTMIVYDGFYWATSELQQGLAVCLLFIAFLHRDWPVKTFQKWILIVLCLIVLTYYHPLVPLVLAYILGYFFIKNKAFRRWEIWIIGLMLSLLVFIKNYISSNWYDTHKTSTFSQNLIADFPDYFSYTSHFKFFENTIQHWYMLPVLLIVTLAFLLYCRRWLLLVYLLVWCFGWVMMLHIASPQTTHRFYAEVNYYPLIIFISLPFFQFVIPHFKKYSSILLSGMAVLLIMRLGTIAHHADTFQNRLKWMDRQFEKMEEMNLHKITIAPQQVPMDTLLITWAMPYESLYYSTLNKAKASKSILITDDEQLMELSALREDLFISVFDTIPAGALAKPYFQNFIKK